MNRIVRSRLGLGAGALALMLVAAACSEVRPDAATVNGVGLPRKEFEDQLQAYVDNEEYQAFVASDNGATVVGPGGNGTITMDFTGRTLRVTIFYELIRQEVERRGLTVTPETLQLAEQQAKGRFAPDGEAAEAVWAEFPGWFQQQAIDDTANLITLQQDLGGGTLDDAGLQAIYDENPALFGLLCARHILVDTEEQAIAIKAELDGGADFAEVAAANGTDGSATSGGLLYTEGEDCPAASQFISEFVDGAATVAVGEVTEPIQTQFGWHVIKVDDAVAVPFEEARDAVRSYAAQNADSALTEFLTEAGRGEITVAPRYGTWDPATTNVIPPGLSTTTSPGATTTAAG